ncbi:MAG: hypothetical protein EOO65_00345 [Methanosarcinales archaeon]|nr:MAG: hypothetical protein EOO65_00345 [Methanosarcinales archaeon]
MQQEEPGLRLFSRVDSSASLMLARGGYALVVCLSLPLQRSYQCRCACRRRSLSLSLRALCGLRTAPAALVQ